MELKKRERQQTLRKRLLKSEFMLFENTFLLFYVTRFIKIMLVNFSGVDF